MKFKNLWILVLAFSLVAISCGDDDKPEDPVTTTDDDGGMNTDDGDSTAMLDMERDETVATLTENGEQKVWKISQATLNNDNGSFDISTNFNVVDDEFVFSGTRNAGSLEWRPGNGIAVDGADAQGALLDLYLSPENSSFAFDADSSSSLTALNGNLTFTVVDDNSITGTLSFPNGRTAAGETIDLSLTEKTSSDYATPQSDLTFSNFAVLFNDCVSSCAPGFAGSYADNSLFLSTRAVASSGSSELLVKYNLDAGGEESFLFTQPDFVSKQLLIRGDQLLVVGGQYINTYDLDNLDNPTSVLHGKSLTRFGTAVQGDDLYILGGDLNQDPNTGEPLEANKIFKYDLASGVLSDFATLPEDRFGARATIVNNKLYIFGGTETWPSNDIGSKNTLYIVDLNTQSIATETMPRALTYSYVERFENLIYVGGRIDLTDSDGNASGRDEFLGVYNTQDNSWTELTTNLSGSTDDFVTIHGMGLFNSKLYIIYDDGLDDDNNPDTAPPNNILVADLN